MQLNNFIKFDLRKKIIATIIIFLLVINSVIYFVIIPTIKDIKQMKSEIEAQRIDLEKKYLKGQSLKRLTENLKKIEPQLARLNQVFINQNRELEFITTLEETADQNSIAQKIDLGIIQDTNEQTFQKNSLKLFTQGNFMRQMNYLTNLEALNYYINIKSLKLFPASAQIMTPEKQQSAQDNINMIISADTYWK